MDDKQTMSLALKEYLITKYQISPEKVTGESSLLHDLEISGDDVDGFFASLINDFNIGVKELNLSRFFLGDEPFDFLSPITRFIKGEKRTEKPTIKVDDIEEFIRSGVLK